MIPPLALHKSQIAPEVSVLPKSQPRQCLPSRHSVASQLAMWKSASGISYDAEVAVRP